VTAAAEAGPAVADAGARAVRARGTCAPEAVAGRDAAALTADLTADLTAAEIPRTTEEQAAAVPDPAVAGFGRDRTDRGVHGAGRPSATPSSTFESATGLLPAQDQNGPAQAASPDGQPRRPEQAARAGAACGCHKPCNRV